MIIGIAGKTQSGKDLVNNISKYIIDIKNFKYTHPLTEHDFNSYICNNWNEKCTWKTVRFADKLKDIVCLMTNCTREQLEDDKFKDEELGEEWTRYGYANGFSHIYRNGKHVDTIMNNESCSKEKYEEELRINWQTAYKTVYTRRKLLQYIGTDLLRNQLHPNIHVNMTMSSYKHYSFGKTTIDSGDLVMNVDKEVVLVDRIFENTFEDKEGNLYKCNNWSTIKYPNWIIPDVRFPNELKAIEDRGGFVIRIERPIKFRFPKLWAEYESIELPIVESEQDFLKWLSFENKELYIKLTHESETALDNHEFEYTIDNTDNSIEPLMDRIKGILKTKEII